MRRAENLVVCGPPGTGKSFLAEALASEGIEAGMRVSWFKLRIACPNHRNGQGDRYP
ncbi:ATP-binding protein [Ferrimicrobium acidiphilum]|uniref:ATP-binding protein n=1 Tax=Ferrimicrobium acidiphilum TaxID=121039 RepID=UPI003AF3D61B